MFLVSVAFKGLRICVSGLESTVTGVVCKVLILNGFTVDEEAAVVVEMERVCVPVWGGSLGKWRVVSGE